MAGLDGLAYAVHGLWTVTADANASLAMGAVHGGYHTPAGAISGGLTSLAVTGATGDETPHFINDIPSDRISRAKEENHSFVR